jgi:phenylalanine-4-hydroxylase
MSDATALAFENKQLNGHGKDYHQHGFSSPVGKLKRTDKALEEMTVNELKQVGIEQGKRATLQFESGYSVSGDVQKLWLENDKLLLITMSNCIAIDDAGNKVFDPEWGIYDMAVGEAISSVFCGAADKDTFEVIGYRPQTTTYHPQYDEKTLALHQLYGQVRQCRQTQTGYEQLAGIWQQLRAQHQDDWLCALEILEMLEHEDILSTFATEVSTFLHTYAAAQPEFTKLINDGLKLIRQPV